MRTWKSLPAGWFSSAPYLIGPVMCGGDYTYTLYRKKSATSNDHQPVSSDHPTPSSAMDEANRIDAASRHTLIGHRQAWTAIEPHREAMRNGGARGNSTHDARDPVTAAQYATRYSADNVIAAIRDVEGMNHEDLFRDIQSHPYWRLTRLDARRVAVHSADDDIVDDYVSADPWHAPPIIAGRDDDFPWLPASRMTKNGEQFCQIDGNHRTMAARIAKVPVLAFIPETDPMFNKQRSKPRRNSHRARSNPEILERCVRKVSAKDGNVSRAYAICTSSLQRSGALKPGTQKLTAKGRIRQKLTETQRATLAKIVRAGAKGLDSRGHFAIPTARALHRLGLLRCEITEKFRGKPTRVTCRATAKGRRAS